MRRWLLLLLIPVVALIGYAGFSRKAPVAGSSPSPRPTATITKGTLTATEDVDGTLGFGDPVTVGGRLPGIVTGLPAEGSTVARGGAMYRVDGHPVVLLYATAPFYRELRPGEHGDDVTAFEANLAALGYRGFTADDSYTGATADAVRHWQEDQGLPQTGTVELGRLVVAPDAVRIGKVQAHAGDNATGPILQWTGATRLVTVQLDVTEQRLAAVGAAASVKLPDDSVVPGRISAIGAVATATVTGNQTKVTVDVTVSVDEQSKLGTYDAAPVKVTLVAEQRENVLTVPVGALVALSEGGYGVQLIDGSVTRTVAVQTGLFAAGRVEVSGPGLAAGQAVGVAG